MTKRIRLHKVYDEEVFDDRLIELTKRLVHAKPWTNKAGGDQLLKVWLHGACLIYDIPEPRLVFEWSRRTSAPIQVGAYLSHDDPYQAQVILRHVSMIGLFHNFRHHMQEISEVATDNQRGYEEAQAWACSLFYLVAPRRFRRMVRAGRIAGVVPEDLLKKKAAV